MGSITEGFTFLGYEVIKEVGTSGKMISKVQVPAKAIKKCQEKLRGMLAPHTYSDSARAKIVSLNRLTQGWCEYYRCTNSPSWVFNKIQMELFWGFAHWLGRKYQISMPAVCDGSGRKTPSKPKQYD